MRYRAVIPLFLGMGMLGCSSPTEPEVPERLRIHGSVVRADTGDPLEGIPLGFKIESCGVSYGGIGCSEQQVLSPPTASDGTFDYDFQQSPFGRFSCHAFPKVLVADGRHVRDAFVRCVADQEFHLVRDSDGAYSLRH